MDASRQLPTHGDGLLDMREPARTPLESMVNEVTDARADMPCEDGANARDGYRERGPATPVGDIAPRIPELGAGAYFPEGVIGRCSRADRGAAAAAAEPWANGVPTRKMGRIARKMGIGGPRGTRSAPCAGRSKPSPASRRPATRAGSRRRACSSTPRASSAGGTAARGRPRPLPRSAPGPAALRRPPRARRLPPAALQAP